MEFMEITEEEFANFVITRPEHNFMQTSSMYHFFKSEGREVYLVGVKDNNKIVAGSLIAETKQKFGNKKAYEAYKGFILDYENLPLLKFMVSNLKKFLKEKKAFKLIIDPYIVNVTRNKEGEQIDGINNYKVKKNLKKLGFKINKYSNQVKWIYCLDVLKTDYFFLENNLRNSTKRYIKKALNKYKLKIRNLNHNELNLFSVIVKDTLLKKGLKYKDLNYYQKMYDAFKDKCVFKICELDCNLCLNTLEEQEKINEILEIKKKYGNIVPIAVGMFILYGDEIIYMFGGSLEEFKKFYGQYALQWEMIKYAKLNNYRRYNFWGIEDLNKNKKISKGVYFFKIGRAHV